VTVTAPNETPKKIDLPTAIFVGVLLVGAALMGWQEATSGILEEGSAAPPFTLERPNGPPIELASLKGKVVVVNFWATWCPPCREELPYLVKTVQEYEPKGVTLVAISNDDRPGQREAVRRFLNAFPQLAPYAALGEPDVGQRYQVQALPSVYVIDRDGHVSSSFQGQATERQLRRWIDAALEN
jgi:thiol-disulfide isomerase/thioredoxin